MLAIREATTTTSRKFRKESLTATTTQETQNDKKQPIQVLRVFIFFNFNFHIVFSMRF
jgi:hypothetical protein